MKTFKEFTQLNETIEKAYSISDAHNVGNNIRYTFETDDGRPGVVVFRKDRVYHKGRIENSYDIEFEVGHSMSMSGKGDAYRILATVVSAIDDFNSRTNIPYYTFTASKLDSGARSRVYTKILDKLLPGTGWVYSKDENSIRTEFLLSRENDEIV